MTHYTLMRIEPHDGDPSTLPRSVHYTRATVDLAQGAISIADVACENVEDLLGGFGRSFQLLATRDVTNALAPDNPLIVTTGLLTGSNVMTGLRPAARRI